MVLRCILLEDSCRLSDWLALPNLSIHLGTTKKLHQWLWIWKEESSMVSIHFRRHWCLSFLYVMVPKPVTSLFINSVSYRDTATINPVSLWAHVDTCSHLWGAICSEPSLQAESHRKRLGGARPGKVCRRVAATRNGSLRVPPWPLGDSPRPISLVSVESWLIMWSSCQGNIWGQ